MYENLSVEDIKKDILIRYLGDAQTNEGSFINDMISTVAYRVWSTLQSLNAVIPIAFVDETSGEYIDKRCAEYGITRKSGTRAITTLTITGIDGAQIEKGTVFLTSDGLEFEAVNSVTIVNGTAEINATALNIGIIYNVAPNTITTQLSSTQGINTVTNSQATGGTEQESDKALLSRLLEHMRNPATSGNVGHYRAWSLEVDGVGDVRVFPLWNGPGTVKVILVGNEKKPVDSTIVNNCYQHIESNRPIGASITVESASGLEISISVEIIIDNTTTLNIVTSEFRTILEDYFKSIAFTKDTVVYNRISHMLLDIKGVEDYTNLTINGGTNNIVLSDEQVPILGLLEVLE